jgi:hypothetical protein
MRNGMRRKWIWIVPLGILALIGFAALGGYVVMQLWNWLVPAVFGWHVITFWQALALLVLCRVLFGGRGMRGFSKRKGCGRGGMNRRFAQWEKLTPEERERLRQGMRGRCGWCADTEGEGNQQA